MDPKENLTSGEKRGIISAGKKPENLDNGIRALPAVQMPFTTTASNSCELRLYFKDGRDEMIRKEIARLILEAALRGGKH